MDSSWGGTEGLPLGAFVSTPMRVPLYPLQVYSLQLVRVLQGGHRAAPITALAW